MVVPFVMTGARQVHINIISSHISPSQQQLVQAVVVSYLMTSL
jgi:hypothetical protein